jgi:hypothetical protein
MLLHLPLYRGDGYAFTPFSFAAVEEAAKEEEAA